MTPEQVQEELMEGVTVQTLKALGVLTERGGASPSARRKVKQVNHLLNQMTPALEDIFSRHEDPIIVDMGAGRATVSLALYDRWIRPKGRGRLLAVESRGDLVDRVRSVTTETYPRLEMVHGEALSAELPERIHLILGLHACDLATDHAIARGLVHKADHLTLVPCCQAEYARGLKQVKESEGALACLWGAGHHRREFGAHLTNVVRCLALRSAGYSVTATELTGWEHSMKNELIMARRVARFHRGAKRELDQLLCQVGLMTAKEEGADINQRTPWLIGELSNLIASRDQEQRVTSDKGENIDQESQSVKVDGAHD